MEIYRNIGPTVCAHGIYVVDWEASQNLAGRAENIY